MFFFEACYQQQVLLATHARGIRSLFYAWGSPRRSSVDLPPFLASSEALRDAEEPRVSFTY